MKKIKALFAVAALILSTTVALAQNIRVTGVVSERNGDGINGAAVQLKGSATVYAMTDATGNYAISVPKDGVLVVSCLGYETVEVPVNGRNFVNVTMDVDTEMLDDVIVIAYGTVRREAATGSVTTMKKEGLAEAPVSSVDKLLAGKMAGVQVTSQTGQPGANTDIRIRGISSLNAGNEPLWVIDGIPVQSGDQSYFTNTSNAMSAINPNDIESITVLKDAAAASIYGSRAANGVILVTTKSGKSGRASFNARVKFGASQLANDNGFGIMNGEQLLSWQRTAIQNAGYNPDDPTSSYYRPNSLLTGPLTNWMKAFTRLGALQEYEINAAAGSDKGKFYSSLAYQKNDGITYGTDFQKFTARVNSDYKLTKNLEIGTRINLAYTMSNDTPMQALYYSNPFFAGMTILPWTPFYDEDGNYNVNIPENSNTNPLYTAANDDQWEKQYRVHGTVYLQWEPVKNLVFKTNNSVETTFGEGRRYWAPDPGDTEGTLQTSTTQYVTLTTSNTATYNFSASDHNFRFMLGQEAMRRSYQYYYAYAPTVDAQIPYLNTAVSDKDQTGYSANYRTLLSFFGMFDYNYHNRYFLTASVRGDGSSLFGSKNQWGVFWSVGGSWNVTNENWMKPTRNWLSLLKVRASYGVNGNNNISPYQAYGVYASAAYNGGNGTLPSTPDNASLSWEKNYTWNVGLDAGFFDSRLNFQVDVYNRKTTDMLLSKQVPQTSGFSSNFMNIGSMMNNGVEVQIDGDIIRNSQVTWNVGFNFAYNKSTILDLGDTDEMTYSDSRIKHKVGERFYTYYLRDYYGVNPSTGAAVWRHHEYDENGNITSTSLTTDYNKASYIYAGSPEPKYTGGFNTSFSWKGLNLSAFFEYKYGNKVLIVENRYINSDGSQMSMNQTTRGLNYWTKPGDTGVFPKPVAGNSSNSYTFASTRWLQDGSYLRLKDITLSYNLPEKWVKAISLKGVKVYVSALNLYTFHDVDFWDPERGLDGMGTGVYPMTKSIVGGLEVSF
ncbi:MAG: TonB-dependent receptor [Bacteroidales bacterium]|nr:TonB-dependent receptor [Bacteroidales bacterium]